MLEAKASLLPRHSRGFIHAKAHNSTSTQIAWKLESASLIAEHNEVSRDEIRRHIRLTHLIPELMELVDGEEIPFMVGVDLSFLDEQAQQEIHHYFSLFDDIRLDLKASAAIKQLFQDGKTPINADTLTKLLNKRKMIKKPKPFSINRNKFKGFADKLPDDKELENLFIEFLRAKFGIEA